MKKMNYFILLAFLFAGTSVQAQFEFKIDFNFDTDRYTVFVIPQATYNSPQNITSDGQVTLRVPTNKFIPVDVQNELQGMHWEATSKVEAPKENPDFDYISFALQIQSGVGYPDYKKDEPMPMFSFKNAYGCNGGTGNVEDAIIALIDNDKDPFMYPNSANANVGNSLSVLGAASAGDGYGYAGLYNGGAVSCDPENPTSTAEELGFSGFRVFPNPVLTEASVEIQWEGDAQEAYLQIVDASGKLLLQEPVSLVSGKNTQRLNMGSYPAGSYFLYLVGNDWDVSLDKLKKQ